MSADFSTIQPQQQKRNGLAIASLVLGIISIPTLGLLGVGAITALVLGAIAISRSQEGADDLWWQGNGRRRDHNQRRLAFTDQRCSAYGAIVVPQMIHGLQHGRESAAIQIVENHSQH